MKFTCFNNFHFWVEGYLDGIGGKLDDNHKEKIIEAFNGLDGERNKRIALKMLSSLKLVYPLKMTGELKEHERAALTGPQPVQVRPLSPNKGKV
jgi:hypothetical protein